MGITNTWQCGATLFAIDEELILRTWKWYLDLLEKDPGLARSTYVLVEVMQKVSSLHLLVTGDGLFLTNPGGVPISGLS